MKKFDDWKNWLLTLPDTPFFNLMRNYLGTLQTPFNKHSMIEELASLLGKEKTHRQISASLDELDRRILTIIYLLGNVPEAPILDMIRNPWSSWEIRQRLTNLQERLLLYKNQHGIYFPVPHLESFLRRNIISTQNLFTGEPWTPEKANYPWLCDSFLTAFVSFVQNCSPALKADGSLTKKSSNELNRIFPVLEAKPDRTGLILKAFEKMKLIAEEEDRTLSLNLPRWLSLTKQTSQDRMLSLWAGTVLDNGRFTTPWNLAEGEKLIDSFIRSLPSDMLYSEETLIRLGQLILFEHRPPREDLKIFIHNLVLLDILVQTPGGITVNPTLKDPVPSLGKVTIHPNMEITLPPFLDLETTIPLAFYCRIIRYEQIGQFILNQESYFLGLHRGKNLPDLRELLKTISKRELPQNMEFSLTHWDNQFRSVRLLQGIVLKVSSDRIPLIEKNPQLCSFIREVLAPGVYLLDPQEKDEWEGSLLSAGIMVSPPVENLSPAQDSRVLHPPAVQKGVKILLDSEVITPPVPEKDPREDLRKLLAQAPLPPEEKDEVSDRIEKKVILFPRQIIQGIAPRETREARGVDYGGKIRLIEEALASGQEYLEIQWFNTTDDLQTDLIIPRHLAKEDPDLILSGPYLDDPGGKDFRIRVRKISNLKRRKLSFFALD